MAEKRLLSSPPRNMGGLRSSKRARGALPISLPRHRSVVPALIWTDRAISEETSSCERFSVGYECHLRVDQTGTGWKCPPLDFRGGRDTSVSQRTDARGNQER